MGPLEGLDCYKLINMILLLNIRRYGFIDIIAVDVKYAYTVIHDSYYLNTRRW